MLESSCSSWSLERLARWIEIALSPSQCLGDSSSDCAAQRLLDPKRLLDPSGQVEGTRRAGAHRRREARRVVVAYSGGRDSTALLAAVLQARRGRSRDRLLHVTVVHVDHGIDGDSGRRSSDATELAIELAQRLPGPGRFEVQVLRLARNRYQSERALSGVEGAARSLRYEALHAAARTYRADAIVTGHHRRDQLETLILRLQQGTGLYGLAGVRPRHGLVLRPFLASGLWPSLEGRCAASPGPRDLETVLTENGFRWIEDPTNQDIELRRNLVRRCILPTLEATDCALSLERAAEATATAALKTGQRLDQRLGRALDLQLDPARGPSLCLRRWLALPTVLQDLGLGLLHRAAGLHHGPPSSAAVELRRQIRGHRQQNSNTDQDRKQLLAAAERCTPADAEPDRLLVGERPANGSARQSVRTSRASISCHCGDGWSWTVSPPSRERLRLSPPVRSFAPLSRSTNRSVGTAPDRTLQRQPKPPPFTYTLAVPGSLEIPEIGLVLTASAAPFEPWMIRRWTDRVALHLPKDHLPENEISEITVRCRRPGDTMNLLGSPSSRVKLKKLLIDRKVPLRRRDRLPLICIDGEIAWVPGVALSQTFSVPQGSPRSTPPSVVHTESIRSDSEHTTEPINTRKRSTRRAPRPSEAPRPKPKMPLHTNHSMIVVRLARGPNLGGGSSATSLLLSNIGAG